ncbi:MAG: hypothetical protein IT535_03735 [Bauldia sp.]|nr:hypothetical protein [Bauldia sp.]
MRRTAFRAGLMVALSLGAPASAFAYGPGATPAEAVVNAAGAVFGQGNFLALIMAGLWLGLLAVANRADGRRARGVALLAGLAGVVAGWVFGAPGWLSPLIAGAGLLVAALIALRVRLPGLLSAVPAAAVVALFALGLGSTLRIGGAPLGYVSAYFATFALSAAVAVGAGMALAGPALRRGGEKMVRGLGVWGAIISLPLIAIALVPQGPGFGAGAVDLTVRSAQLEPEEVRPVVSTLLERVYLAFEAEDENEIFDALDAVAEGTVRDDLYLQRRAALVMEDTGGARASLRSLDLLSADGEPLPGNSGYSVHSEWTVTGTVGHWGHIHDRVNRYAADLAIAPVDGVWKIAGFELTDAVRTGTTPVAAPAP